MFAYVHPDDALTATPTGAVSLDEADVVTREYHMRVIEALVAERNTAQAEVKRLSATHRGAVDPSEVERVRAGLDRLFGSAGGCHDDEDARDVIALVKP